MFRFYIRHLYMAKILKDSDIQVKLLNQMVTSKVN